MAHSYFHSLISALLLASLCLMPHTATAQLRQRYYDNTCRNVELIVRDVVKQKIAQTFVTVPAILRIYFHDCFVNGCDASVLIHSPNNDAEKDHPDNLSLAGDGFDVVIKAKEALAKVPGCQNISCADILTIATRDAANFAGAKYWEVELGRLDGLVSTAASVGGKLPTPFDDVNKLTALFNSHGLSVQDMAALSGAHTVGFSHCSKVFSRIYGFNATHQVDPTLDPNYAAQLQKMCPQTVDSRVAINMDPLTPTKFDNWYYKNLIANKGLFKSDQVLYNDPRTKGLVTSWANDTIAFKTSFGDAMRKLGRVGVKTGTPGSNGNIRLRCDALN